MSTGTTVIVNLLGSVALLLWGVRMVRTGMMRAWGQRLKLIAERNLGAAGKAFLTGAGVTLLLQSGTATALIVTGLAAGGLVQALTGLAMLLGADLGSALVVSAYALGGPLLAVLAPLLLFAGFVTFSASEEFRPKNAGRILMGLGLMLLALRLIGEASQPLRDASLFHSLLAVLAREPVIAVLVGAATTWLSHSTLAMALLITSLIANGSLDIAGALPLLAGLNLGAGLPAFVATAGQPAAARRLPAANLLCRGLLAVASVPLLGQIGGWLAATGLSGVHQALLFHVGFNLVLAAIALPLARPVMALVGRLLPAAPASVDPLAAPRYLDAGTLAVPAAAIANAQSEAVRMTELLDRMMATARTALKTGKVDELKQIVDMDERLNLFQRAVHAYLARVTEHQLDSGASHKAMNILLYVSNLEHAGDIVHLSLCDRLRARQKDGLRLTATEVGSLDALFSVNADSLKLSSSVLTASDVDAALRLMSQKEHVREFTARLIERHFKDHLSAEPDALRSSALYVDIVRDLHQIHSHIASAAYPIIDSAGLLRASRVRDGTKRSAG